MMKFVHLSSWQFHRRFCVRLKALSTDSSTKLITKTAMYLWPLNTGSGVVSAGLTWAMNTLWFVFFTTYPSLIVSFSVQISCNGVRVDSRCCNLENVFKGRIFQFLHNLPDYLASFISSSQNPFTNEAGKKDSACKSDFLWERGVWSEGASGRERECLADDTTSRSTFLISCCIHVLVHDNALCNK